MNVKISHAFKLDVVQQIFHLSSAVDYVLFLRMENPSLRINENEVSDAFFVSLQHLQRMVKGMLVNCLLLKSLDYYF